MYFDDLLILRTIDRLERAGGGGLHSGTALLAEVTGGEAVVEDRDLRAFIRELQMATEAKLVEFAIFGWPNQPPDIEAMGANTYLQNMHDFRLTPEGHDRASARVFEREWPDPNEDDGRPISTLTLQAIARIIGEALAGWQLPDFLAESGIPRHYIPEFDAQTKWRYVHEILEGLQAEGAAARRSLRSFLGAFLSDELHIAPGDAQRSLLDDLARQGWHVGASGRLVVGERGPRRRQIPTEHPVFGTPARTETFDCFVVMPFSEPYLTIYREVIVPVAEELQVSCGHVGEIFGPGRIIADIYSFIVGSRVVVAELTGRNANVFYELGIAHAHAKPVVQLSQEINDVPFDVRDLRTVVYEWEDADRSGATLRQELARHLREALR